jgi:hypothetical protein
MPPLAIAFLIIVAVSIVGMILMMFRGKSTFSGYEDLAPEARAIAKALTQSEIFRDGTDLVVSGNFRKLPTIVRFSYDENTPGVNIHMKAPSTFTMSVVPKGARATEGRVMVRTPDEMFDARFTTRSDNPTQAKMFTGGKVVMQALQKVCCSSKTFFTIVPGAMEVSELTIPQPYTARHVSDHIDQLARLAQSLGEMPGSESMKIKAMQREGSSWLVRAAVVVGAVAAVVTVVAATQDYGKPQKIDFSRDASLPAGILPADAQFMGNLDGWRVATAGDFQPATIGWLRDNDREPAGRIEGDFTGLGSGNDVVYFLVNTSNGNKRVAMLGHGASYYDVNFPSIAAIGRLPKQLVNTIEWKAAPVGTPDGDGLVIVADGNDNTSGIVLFLSGGKIISGKPADYTRLRLE